MRITLTQRVFYHKGRAYDCSDQVWTDLLSGHTLSFLPNTPTTIQNTHDILDRTDLLILTGGNRVFPGQNYNETRQQLEFKLIGGAVERGLPVVGVCRGFQMLTLYCGGSLDPVSGHMETDHEVLTTEGPRVVNSYHGLKISQMPLRCTSVAADEDGHCEAWIDDTKTLGGTMWHPERMSDPVWPEPLNEIFKWP